MQVKDFTRNKLELLNNHLKNSLFYMYIYTLVYERQQCEAVKTSTSTC